MALSPMPRDEGSLRSTAPLTLGHEIVGRVVELGAGVSNVSGKKVMPAQISGHPFGGAWP
jgi:D-arabinose 1-dehydrogenase-like Zn-dependent alcohol dehydrogenase